MQREQIQDLEVLLGHSFRDKGFLVNALSHSSVKSEHRPSNERLEFLGDSVLGMIISEALYRRFPEDDEGTLTRIKGQAVSRATLQRVATAMGLDRYILVGKGVLKREIPASLLGNLFEAIVGAIYLDAGLAAARKFVLRHLDIVVEEIVEDRAEKNYKSLLQHYCQRELGGVPGYRVLREAGPAHDRHFDVAVHVNGKEYGRARAASKKEAEQGSARAAMLWFRALDENPNVPMRGAGQMIRIGPEGEGGGKRRRGRRGRGGRGGSADAPRAEAPRAQAPRDEAPRAAESGGGPGAATPADKEGGRRRRRRKRKASGGAAAPAEARVQAEAPPEPRQEAAPAAASADAGAAPAKKKRRSRKRKKKAAAGGGEATAPAAEAAPPANGEAPSSGEGAAPRKKSRRRRRKKKSGAGAEGGS